MKIFIEIIKKKWIRSTAQTAILIIILITCFIALNLWVQSLNLTAIDITPEKLYTLSDESKEQIAKIDVDVNIYLFGYSETDSLVDLIKQYGKVNPKVNSEVVNLTERPDLVQKYEVTEEDVGIVIESQERVKVLSSYDLYTYDYDTGTSIDIAEEKLTNALLETTIADKPKLYFLTGHNEYSLSSELYTLGVYVQNEINDIEFLDLLVTNKVPEDANLLVICSPETDLTEFEADLIIEYINNGGKILYFQDPVLNETTLSNMQKILDIFGVSVVSSIFMESDSNKILFDYPNIAIPELSYHTITQNMYGDKKVALVNSGRLEFVDVYTQEEMGLEIQDILTSSETSYFRTDLTIGSTKKVSSDEEGVFPIGSEIIKTISEENNIKAKLIIYANNAFITDISPNLGNSQTKPYISIYNNKDFVLNTIAYLTEREDTITIRKDNGWVTYMVTQQEDTIIKVIIFTFPVIIIIIGTIIWQIRRRKK